MRGGAGRVCGGAGVVAAVLEVQLLDDEGARVLVVAPDRDGVRDGPVQVEQRRRPRSQPRR